MQQQTRHGFDRKGRLVPGSVIKYTPGFWFVAMVNDSRARIEPLSPTVKKTIGGKDDGKSFASFEDGTSIGASSMVEVVDEGLLNEAELKRYRRFEIDRLENVMAKAVSAAVVDASLPAATKTNAQLNKERLEALKASKAQAKAEKAATPKEPKAPKEPKFCKCGCGGATGSNFVPGHDARFKGWLLQIEKGLKQPADLMPEAVYTSYKWKKSLDGKGLIPTTNYNGQPHSGYLTSTSEA